MTPQPPRPAEVTGSTQTDQDAPGNTAQDKAAKSKNENRSARGKMNNKDKNNNNNKSDKRRINSKNMRETHENRDNTGRLNPTTICAARTIENKEIHAAWTNTNKKT